MRTDLCTPTEVEDAVVRLARVFDQLDTSDESLDEWKGVMARRLVTAVGLARAVDDYLDSDTRFAPKPGQIARRARELDPPPAAAARHDETAAERCGSCGGAIRFAGARVGRPDPETGQLPAAIPRLRCDCPSTSTRWVEGLDPWPETGRPGTVEFALSRPNPRQEAGAPKPLGAVMGGAPHAA